MLEYLGADLCEGVSGTVRVERNGTPESGDSSLFGGGARRPSVPPYTVSLVIAILVFLIFFNRSERKVRLYKERGRPNRRGVGAGGEAEIPA